MIKLGAQNAANTRRHTRRLRRVGIVALFVVGVSVAAHRTYPLQPLNVTLLQLNGGYFASPDPSATNASDLIKPFLSKQELLGQLSTLQPARSSVQSEAVAVYGVSSSGLTTQSGSGIVLESDGLIVTNNHVIEGMATLYVMSFLDDAVRPARVVGTDRSQDIAVIDAAGLNNLQPATFADNDMIDQAVIAAGNAAGVGRLYQSSGVLDATNVSATANSLLPGYPPEHLNGLISTTCDILPGESGGPLFDSAGQVIGMDTLGATSPVTGLMQAASSAIPSQTVIQAVNRLLAHDTKGFHPSG